MVEGGRRTSTIYESHFETSFAHFFTLMNYAGAAHTATPDHDALTAPII